MSTAKPGAPQEAQQPDWFLQQLVEWVNTMPFDFGVTLHVAGFLVSGTLISGAQYFSGFAEDFSGGFMPASEVAETFRKTITSYGETYKTDEKKKDEDSPLPVYIHLKNARFFTTSGNPAPRNAGVWWRGRISEVSGFVLGTLGSGS
jgi:hypothetical protein